MGCEPHTTSTALLPVSPGRPPVLVVQGCKVFVAVHDEYYRRTFREFKNRCKLTHPDLNQRIPVRPFASTRDGQPVIVRGHARKSGSGPDTKAVRAFRRLRRRFELWLAEETRWYAALGLEPPAWGT
jgi:hypothetical protein